jgi:putative FmdB family regulatory protein
MRNPTKPPILSDTLENMPTYEYKCDACGHQFEELQSIKSKALRKCPSCGKLKLIRLIGAGAGIIFKGSGFYQTDYRSESYNKGSKDAKAPEVPAKKESGETKAEPPKAQPPKKESGKKDSGKKDA